MVRLYKFPFYAGEDIKEGEISDYFCDREQETKEMVHYLSSKTKHHIAIIGKRRIGKSSLMLRCKMELEKIGIASVYIRVEKTYPFTLSNLFSYLLREIEKTYQKSYKERMKDTGKSFMKSVKPKKIGVDISQIVTLWAEFDSQDKEKDLHELIDKTFVTIDKVGQQCGKIVIMLDEFQKVFEFGPDFLWTLRGFIQDLKSTSFVVSSSMTSFEDEIIRNKKQPFFNFFFPKKIKELPEDEVRSFVIHRFNSFQIKLEKDALDLIIDRSDCHPYYVQLLGLKCFEIAKFKEIDIINKNDVLEAYENIFDLLPHHLISEYEKLTGKMREIVVIMATKELDRPRDIAQELNINTRSIGAFLNKIENRHGIIERAERGKYKFVDNFLRGWIKRNCSLPEEKPIIKIESEEPFNSELIDNYIKILKTKSLSPENANRRFQSIRYEVLKVYRSNKIKKKDLPTIKKLILFAKDIIKKKDREALIQMFDILSLLTKTPETLQLLKEKCLNDFKKIYEKGESNKDLVHILDACGYFSNRTDAIIKALDEKDEKLFDLLFSKMNLSEISEEKWDFINKLILKVESLDKENDKNFIERIEYWIRQLEIA
ncbi:MAG: ATP-binding protein [Thermoplasmata archaeon]|nr:MAG: ATP-binding protein [Thermoplasmata archaeon]